MKKEDIKEKKENNYTHMLVILDRSGSMAGLTNSTIAGFNGFMKEQKNVSGKATASLVQFATNQSWVYDFLPIQEVSDLTTKTYEANGSSTALCDSIARAVHRTEDQIKGMEEKPDNIVVVIITDGLENSSKEFKKDYVCKIIKSHEEEGWDFVFLGANQDAISEGGNVGIRSTNAMTYAANAEGIQYMYACVSSGLTSYRNKRSSGDTGKIGFFIDEEEEEKI